ncbi:branched-chain amino acid ABC transporter permease [Modestobacter sp. SYSU DS0875]
MDSLISFALSTTNLFGFYALLALGLGLVFGQLGVVNVAHGDLVMVGAYLMYALAPVPFVPRVLLAVLVAVALGLLAEWSVLRELYSRGMLATLLAMWGLGIVLRQLAEAVFGATPRSVEAPIEGSTQVLGVPFPTYRLVATGVSLAVVALALLVVYRTTLGLKLRASIGNRDMAAVLGIPPRLMIAGTFAVGTVLAVLAGALQSPTLGLTPGMGVAFLAPAFFAVLIGRPGSLTGPVAGAFVVALLSSVLRRYLTETVAELLLFAALVVLIAARPAGLSWRLPSWSTRTRNVA